MPATVLTYRVPQLPDPFSARHQLAADGDVRRAFRRCSEHLLRTLVNFPPESVSLTLRFLFHPQPENLDPQARLNIYVVAAAFDQSAGTTLRLLLEQGPLSGFYHLQPVDGVLMPPQPFTAACSVVRLESAIDPSCGPEFNPKIPPVYYAIRSFEPREENDCMQVDRVLSRLAEPVCVDISVQPTDVSPELFAHTRYLARLQAIRRTTFDEADEPFDPALLPAERGYPMPLGSNLHSIKRSDVLGEHVLHGQQEFHKTLIQPHLAFHIRVLAHSEPVARLLSSVVGESAFEEGSYRLVATAPGQGAFATSPSSLATPRVNPVATHDALFGHRDGQLYRPMARLASVAPADQLSAVFRLPLASHSSPCCIRKDTDPPHVPADRLLVLGRDQQLSADGTPTTPMPRGIELGKLNKHACIFGVPGSGKTGAIFNLLLPLYDRAITFMVIESAKTEYRVLKTLKDHGNPSVRRLASEFQVYTLGDDTLSPFRENLLARVEGISPGEHIESILGNFQAAMPMSGPLPALLGEALERVFDAGGGATPRMADLVRATREVLAEKGYSPETTSDIRAALEVRLGVLIRRGIGRVFQCRQSVPSIEQLASAPSVIELDRLSRDHKALITLSLLTRLLQFFKTRPYPDQSVRFVLFIEEAHNIVGPSHEAAASEENADPRAFAADLICRMLAELRALGVAIVIVDQLPTAVAPEVIKNTATKLAFRQPEKEEREVLAGAMRLGPVETEELAVLQPGEAYLYTEGYYAARRIRTPNVYEELNIGRPPIGDRILPYLQDDPWFARAATERCSDELDQLLDQLNLFDLETDQLVGRIKLLCQRHPAILADHQGPARRQALVELRRQSRRLKAEILDRLRTFQRDVYRPLLGDVSAAPLGDCGLSDLRAHVIDRYENTTKPATQGCAQVLDRLIGRCATSTT